MSGDAPRWLMFSMSVICGTCGLMHVFSRAYLIVEAFVSLRLPPVGPYVVPEWTLGVPHVA